MARECLSDNRANQQNVGNDPSLSLVHIARCNISQDHPDFVHAPFRVTSMTSANAVRRLRSTIPARRRTRKGRLPLRWLRRLRSERLAAMALVNRHLAKKAERDNPAAGRFLDVEWRSAALY